MFPLKHFDCVNGYVGLLKSISHRHNIYQPVINSAKLILAYHKHHTAGFDALFEVLPAT